MSNLHVDEVLRQHAHKADRLMVIILWAMLGIALALSQMHDTFGLALAVGIPAAAIPTLLTLTAGGARVTRMATAFALVVMCALHIHQGGGRDELHFGLFVALAFLLCYRDWSVIVVAAGLIAVHHLSFNYLQELGYGVRCLTEPGIGMVLVHAGYVVAETIVLCYLARILQREALQSAELRVSVAALQAANGAIDLRAQLPAQSDSGRALQEVVALLGRALTSVQHSVHTTSSASHQIAEGNAELSQRSERQSASIQATVASMAELTTTVRQNAEHARQADALAGSASNVATRGGQVVTQVVERMEAIDASSRRIADIITVIDGIAFQTNILALNAAVEAARAGEQGRGFAVVASEVRNLAQRSASAAREIKALIDESVAQVSAGSTLAQQAGRTMDEVVESVHKVSGIIGEISSASREQAQELAAVSEAIGAMDDDTRNSAAMVRDAATAAGALKDEATHLAEVVAVFHLDAVKGAEKIAPKRTALLAA
ncbi:methyl-accepting chemotaxis protein [Massilia sp. CMS3.1]|uniref:methyl-accepting chemotaxis protein n=1 Tax=Massilia sp. CMS3.1 TaxID=3373083 RepID=UPI003EE74847